jgi:hypothetical protein
MRFFHEAISLATTIVSPFPSADSALVCLASTEATHVVPGAFSNARFFVFLAFALMTFRVVSPPQRKQVIGRLSFRLRKDLQYAILPSLFSPHPSVLQFLDSFSALKHSEQASLWVDRKTPHPHLAASKTYLFSTSAVAHDRQCVVGNIPLHAGHFGWISGPGQPMWMWQKYHISHTKGGPRSFGGGLREMGSRWRAGPV